MVRQESGSDPGEPVVVVLDSGQSDRSMRRTVLAGSEGAPHDLVIDMRSVESVSREAMDVLLSVRARQRARQRKLTLVCSSGSATEQVLSRSGMRRKFTTTTDLS